MRQTFFTLIVLAAAGMGYASAPTTAPSTQPTEACCCKDMMKTMMEKQGGMPKKMMMDMHGGMGKMMMDGNAPTTQPAKATPDEHAAHHH